MVISNFKSRSIDWSLNSMKGKDGSVDGGVQMFNNSNTMGEDSDAHLRPDDVGETHNLGDMSSIFGYGGQSKTNRDPNFNNLFEIKETVDNLGLGLSKVTDPLSNTNTTSESRTTTPRTVVDPLKKDTVSVDEARSRQIDRKGKEDFSNWIILRPHEYKY